MECEGRGWCHGTDRWLFLIFSTALFTQLFIRFCLMGHVWNMTRWGCLELKYYKCYRCVGLHSSTRWEILNIWASTWASFLVVPRNGRQELKNATALAALKHPRKKPVLGEVQASSTILTSPGTKQRMMRMWESKVALMEFKQVRGSRMNRVQWEKNFYKVNLKIAQWITSVFRINWEWEYHGDFDSPKSKVMQKCQITSWYHPN